MFEEIRNKREEIRNNILKSFNADLENWGGDIEKAHKDGDMHKNGKWVWVSSAAGGKGDWRTLNGRTHKNHQANNAAGSSEGGSNTGNGVGSSTTSSVKTTSSIPTKKTAKTSSKKSALPDTMLEIHRDMDRKYGNEIRPFTYTSNGVKDLTNDDKKGFAVWIGFQHEMRGRQPVNRDKMKNFVNNTAIPNFINEIYERTGKKFKKEDVKIDDHWNNTDMFRIYLLTDKNQAIPKNPKQKGIDTQDAGKGSQTKEVDFITRAKKESDVPLKKLRGKTDELDGNVTIGKSSYYLNIRTADDGKNYDIVIKDNNGNSKSIGLKTLVNLSKQIKYEMKPSYKKVAELDGAGDTVINVHKVKNAKLEKERL